MSRFAGDGKQACPGLYLAGVSTWTGQLAGTTSRPPEHRLARRPSVQNEINHRGTEAQKTEYVSLSSVPLSVVMSSDPLPLSALSKPRPITKIFEHFRSGYATDLLASPPPTSTCSAGWRTAEIACGERSAWPGAGNVLFHGPPGLELIVQTEDGRLDLAPAAHGTSFGGVLRSRRLSVGGETPGVRPRRAAPDQSTGQQPGRRGPAFIFRDRLESAMGQEASARRPRSAGRPGEERGPVQRPMCPREREALDVDGGCGIYAIGCATGRTAGPLSGTGGGLNMASEMVAAYDVADQVDPNPRNMFVDPLPAGVDVTCCRTCCTTGMCPSRRHTSRARRPASRRPG